VLPGVTLLLGGGRSGKSRYGESMIDTGFGGGTYIATAQAGDAEMGRRIAAHRARRAAQWITVEEPIALAEMVGIHSRADRAILVDCLTLWLSNLMAAARDLDKATDGLLAALAAAPGPVVLVSNEVGMGIVPMIPLGRDFRDAAGMLNQRVAAVADAVALMVAGLPLVLKGQNWFKDEER